MQNYQTNKEDNIFKDLVKTNPLSIIVFYLIVYVFGTFLISLIVCAVVSNKYGLTFQNAFQIGMGSLASESKTDFTNSVYYEVQAYTNLFSYILLFITTGFLGRSYLKEDAKIFQKFKSALIMILVGIGFALFNWGLSELGNLIIEKISTEGTSQNELLIQNMIKSGHAVPVGFSVILFAPLTEELVYRKSIMELADKLKPVWQILISAVVFAAPHMISSVGYSFAVFSILFIEYFLAGLALALIYYFSKKNIYSSLIAHTISNTFAYALIFR